MAKTRRRKKLSQKRSKRKQDAAENLSIVKIPGVAVFEPRFQKKSILLQLAGNPNFVGAMQWMLAGCFACGGFIGVLFAEPDLGRYYSKILYKIASFIPNNFIPPDTYIPGVLTMPVLLLIIAGFTAHGYRTGATPPKIEPGKDTRSFIEKLLEFIILLIICLTVLYYRNRSDHPDTGFIEAFSDPFFIALIIILISGLFFYTFSRHQSQQYLMFVLYSAIPVGFVLFLLGLVAHALIKFVLYALNY